MVRGASLPYAYPSHEFIRVALGVWQELSIDGSKSGAPLARFRYERNSSSGDQLSRMGTAWAPDGHRRYSLDSENGVTI